jgi:SAM-dependent methyltransferase
VADELSVQRRLSFGAVAELYEQARPSYPASLVDDVVGYAGIEHGDAVLEVGAGTGKATRLFAARGYRIVALEPSAQMAAIARRTFADHPSVQIVESDFESWPAPLSPFRLLISGQAWHWTDPATRYAKAHANLRPGGALAAFWNWPAWRGCPLREELDAAYREIAPGIERGDPMRPSTDPEDLGEDWEAEIADAGGFADAEVREYERDYRYASDEYVRLLSTTSNHLLLEPATRDRLLDRIAAVIDSHGGVFELPLVTRLCLARAV